MIILVRVFMAHIEAVVIRVYISGAKNARVDLNSEGLFLLIMVI